MVEDVILTLLPLPLIGIRWRPRVQSFLTSGYLLHDQGAMESFLLFYQTDSSSHVISDEPFRLFDLL